ncbi:calcium-binding protein [Aeromicrobium sp. Root495]|uniref:excalibur calcium-binding domain-containing protein n=1 Tax=Aeromicrobium sp. Root495 TaxID=1736550 RepID=UPI0006FA8333|nr:excalibur calcium-binding domain-containing protein [Aeromicrobium sp. Root495]KQY58910.1 calcium-binding protein [Aeromicrobium sp. Root495]
MRHSVLAAALAAAVVLVPVSAEAATTYKNCTALHKKYPHGVGMPGAKDKTSGTPVTSFKRSKALYQANKKSDRDKDKIACEKK